MTQRLTKTRPAANTRAKGMCPGCQRPVYRGGIWLSGRYWHESCFRKS